MLWLDGVPILMYHEVAKRQDIDDLARRTQRGYILPLDDFEHQMAFLAEAGFHSISLSQLLAWCRMGAQLPPNPVVITFDDGFAGNHRYAFPILRRHGLNATFFVVSNRMGDSQMMGWSDLREMIAGGMAVESHTANHPLLSTLSESRTQDELSSSKLAIEDKLGRAVQFLSLPNGDSNSYYRSAATGAGYLGGCGSGFGFNVQATDHYQWRRFAIKQGLGINRFRGLLLRRRSTILRLAAQSSAKTAVARLLGKSTYDRLYNAVFGVQEQDKSKHQ
jgi:peptidoglycan/xylan/chitin deacetylase (PgdA/CDA1 family)